MQPILIQNWWPHVEPDAKAWLRENNRAHVLPPKVLDRIAEAGGPIDEPVLTEHDWNFIEAQPEPTN